MNRKLQLVYFDAKMKDIYLLNATFSVPNKSSYFKFHHVSKNSLVKIYLYTYIAFDIQISP